MLSCISLVIASAVLTTMPRALAAQSGSVTDSADPARSLLVPAIAAIWGEDRESLPATCEVDRIRLGDDDTPYLSARLSGRDLLRIRIPSAEIAEAPEAVGLDRYEFEAFVDPEVGTLLKVVATRRNSDRVSLPYPDSAQATEELRRRGPEVWQEFVTRPRVSLVQAMRPLWPTSDNTWTQAPINGLCEATQWTAYCVELSFGPNADTGANWVFHIRGLPTPTQAQPKLAAGHARVRIDAASGKWLHSGKALAPRVDRAALEAAGLFGPTDEERVINERILEVRRVLRGGARNPLPTGPSKPGSASSGLPFAGHFMCELTLDSPQ